jgi:hypothetical protein
MKKSLGSDFYNLKEIDLMNSNRRDFLKLSGMGLVAGLISTKILTHSSHAEAADAVAEPVKASDPLAVSLGYNPNATKVDAKKWPKRAGPDGAKQFCSNCQFFQGDGKSKQAACTIFGGKIVKSTAWCNTWTKKA